MYAIAQRPAAPAPAARDLLTALAQANNFSLGALAANRAGHLAPEQATFLRRRARRRLLLGLIATGGALLFAIAVGVAEGGRSIAQIGLFGGIIALAGGQLVITSVKTLNDARAGAVAVLEGLVTRSRGVDTDESGNSTIAYYYQVGAQKFRVAPAAYTALPAGTACRLYYAPGGKELLSIEPLAAPEV
ncbi:MAG: hypothetical protein ACJ8CR_02790 [Roseiflexaceae bacterium]